MTRAAAVHRVHPHTFGVPATLEVCGPGLLPGQPAIEPLQRMLADQPRQHYGLDGQNHHTQPNLVHLPAFHSQTGG
jgi:hypothetical protein